MNSILLVDHETKRFKAFRYSQYGEFEFDLKYSGWIFHFVNQIVLPDLGLFDLTSDLMPEADERQFLFI